MGFSLTWGNQMVKRMCVVAALALLAVPAVAQEPPDFVKNAKATLTKNFKDPDSAQYRGLFIAQEGSYYWLCGEVNAKNSYGAYVGFRRFYASEYITVEIRNPGREMHFDAFAYRCDKKVRDL